MTFSDHITVAQAALIRNSNLFFVASAAPDLAPGAEGIGPVNVSPKGLTPLHVLDRNRVAYLDYPGSGNETARHAMAGGPVTVMVMSMEAEEAAIVRLYGRATVTPVEDSPLAEILLEGAPKPEKSRQVIEIAVDKTQASCGYGVPVYDFRGARPRAGRGNRYRV